MATDLKLRGLGLEGGSFTPIDQRLTSPRVLIGRHPNTGVIHRLTISSQGRILIERKPYVSDHPDGWTHAPATVEDEVDRHLFLILAIEQNPAEWPK